MCLQHPVQKHPCMTLTLSFWLAIDMCQNHQMLEDYVTSVWVLACDKWKVKYVIIASSYLEKWVRLLGKAMNTYEVVHLLY